jgi:hypothetical protein
MAPASPASVGLLKAMSLTEPGMPEAAKAGPLQETAVQRGPSHSSGRSSSKHNAELPSAHCGASLLAGKHAQLETGVQHAMLHSEMCKRPGREQYNSKVISHANELHVRVWRRPEDTHQSLLAPAASARGVVQGQHNSSSSKNTVNTSASGQFYCKFLGAAL